MDDDKHQQQQAHDRQLAAAQQAGLLRFNIPEHTPIIIGEVAGRTLHRIEVREIARDHEQQQHLQTVMPAWIVDVLQGVCVPSFVLFAANLFLFYNQTNMQQMIIESHA